MNRFSQRLIPVILTSKHSILCVSIALITLCSNVHSADFFICEGKASYYLNEQGKMEEYRHSPYPEGEIFVLQAETGVIEGSFNNTGVSTRPKVILDGKRKNQPFTAVTVDAKERYVYQLYIMSSDKKDRSFALYRGYDLVSGLCMSIESSQYDHALEKLNRLEKIKYNDYQ